VARRAARRRAGEGRGSEKAFLASYDASRYPRPSVAVDVALLSAGGGDLFTVVVKRGEHPFQGHWSLPGGFVGPSESLEEAAARVLARETGLKAVFLEQLYTFGAPDRDPRTRVISVGYYALVDRARFAAVEAAGREAAVVRLVVPWEGETGGPVEVMTAKGERAALAFDHAEVLGMAVKRLRGKLNYTPIGFQLLPQTFTLLDLQNVHETVLGRPLNKDSFRRRMLASGLLEATGETQKDVDHRPAELYRFARRSAT
jgi:8-oxo-dGTP diphosphatase